MLIPFVSTRSTRDSRGTKRLRPRKGGGGGGGRGGGGGGGSKGGGGSSGKGGGSSGSSSSSGKGGSSSGSSSSSGGSKNPPKPISSGGTTKSASSYGPGGGAITTIPSGAMFAGRNSGGGTRAQVFGSKQYGSGYPSVASRGVSGRGFPFVFWPVAWGGVVGAGTGAYLHHSEYGRPNNSSRPGGPLATTVFISNSTNSTFRILADNVTISELISDIQANCSIKANASSPLPYEDSLSALPQPEQTIQYYRASSVALTLDGYNNSAVFEPDGSPDTPLPSNIDNNLLNCLNYTIGAAVPLVSGSSDVAPEVFNSALRNQGILLLWFVWLIGFLT